MDEEVGAHTRRFGVTGKLNINICAFLDVFIIHEPILVQHRNKKHDQDRLRLALSEISVVTYKSGYLFTQAYPWRLIFAETTWIVS
ncbi:MAG: hypothetical protein MUE42_01850 [Opitutaceae bacterium]|jgi:hypothetical protein|nr:hypothetical protein [Opitutaceae bacterium]